MLCPYIPAAAQAILVHTQSHTQSHPHFSCQMFFCCSSLSPLVVSSSRPGSRSTGPAPAVGASPTAVLSASGRTGRRAINHIASLHMVDEREHPLFSEYRHSCDAAWEKGCGDSGGTARNKNVFAAIRSPRGAVLSCNAVLLKPSINPSRPCKQNNPLPAHPRVVWWTVPAPCPARLGGSAFGLQPAAAGHCSCRQGGIRNRPYCRNGGRGRAPKPLGLGSLNVSVGQPRPPSPPGCCILRAASRAPPWFRSPVSGAAPKPSPGCSPRASSRAWSWLRSWLPGWQPTSERAWGGWLGHL